MNDANSPAGDVDFPIRACAWPRREPRPGTVRMITPEEFRTWILVEDDEVLVLNKPGDVVCHPSKNGPWSSLVGAAREHTGLPVMHLIFRLDRETSGIVVFAKKAALASRLQKAMQQRRVKKTYLAILTGELPRPVTVDQPLGPDVTSPVFVKNAVRAGGQFAVTHFAPLTSRAGFTVVRVGLETGRKHQIRAHAQWLGHLVVGDKIYGPDARHYLTFIDHGFTAELADALLLSRQALHCAAIDLTGSGYMRKFSAPLPDDLNRFICDRMGIEPGSVEGLESGSDGDDHGLNPVI